MFFSNFVSKDLFSSKTLSVGRSTEQCVLVTPWRRVCYGLLLYCAVFEQFHSCWRATLFHPSAEGLETRPAFQVFRLCGVRKKSKKRLRDTRCRKLSAAPYNTQGISVDYFYFFNFSECSTVGEQNNKTDNPEFQSFRYKADKQFWMGSREQKMGFSDSDLHVISGIKHGYGNSHQLPKTMLHSNPPAGASGFDTNLTEGLKHVITLKRSALAQKWRKYKSTNFS